MSLPSSFFSALMKGQKVKHVSPAFVRVHERYCSRNVLPLQGNLEHLAYALYRMPATYAAVRRVLNRMPKLPFTPTSLLDLGSGPGTAILALQEHYPSLSHCVGLEKSEAFIRISSRLLPDVVRSCDVEKMVYNDTVDLFVASYSIGELSSKTQQRWLAYAASHARVCILVEPGTPAGWETILACRKQLMEQGMHIVAPCPHDGDCPLIGTRWWCHESVRLSRTRFHRWIKGGRLGYEDEKFSYLIAVADPMCRAEARIIHAPRHRSGHTYITLCQTDGKVHQHIVSRKNKSVYALAKRAQWGDAFEDPKQWKVRKHEDMCGSM